MKRLSGISTLSLILILLSAKLAFAGEKVFFYHTDPAGTPLAMTDENNTVVWKADYKPFGEEQSITGTGENSRRFVGKEKDSESGLQYFGARYMKDEIGRFITVDPVGPVDSRTSKTKYATLTAPQRLNRYAYALNNPYAYIDPDGRDIAVIVGYPQGKNIFGHVAAAVTGRGIFSSGTSEPFGTSFTDYLKTQATYRNSTVYIVPTSKEQDDAFVKAFMEASESKHSALRNNCADVTGEGLKAAGLIGPNAALKLPSMINSYMILRADEGKVSSIVDIDKGNQQWGELDKLFSPFNPKPKTMDQ